MYLYSSIGYSMQRSSLPHLVKRAMTAQAAIIQFVAHIYIRYGK